MLFHEGFAKTPERWNVRPEQRELIGNVPYLNGGLFDVHELESKYEGKIRIPDEAFAAIFAFFRRWRWTLDERPLGERPQGKDGEINPDVLGYIFEKYINQKEMGAYYTKEDITDYIGKNTIIPHVFDAARKDCKIAFDPEGAVWRLLRENPDAYLYPAMKKGIIDDEGDVIPLPGDIEAGVEDVSQRDGWNQLAWLQNPDRALPTETWREYVARRRRCLEAREKLQAGEVHEINDLVAYNLDLRQFAQDVIASCEGPETLRALYKAISTVTVLDPACGSGAFLFAALNILEPLYEACLDRMQAFVEDLERSGEPHSPLKFKPFREALAEVEKHPSRTYFILKSIIVQNLYGVDLMEEAVEICKLRLFLKLVSQVERVKELEPLPDVDFNVRAGNALVGYASRADVQAALGGQRSFDFDDALRRIEEQAEVIDGNFRQFHEQQTKYGGSITAEDKRALRDRQRELSGELDRYLADQYSVTGSQFEAWRGSHEPFHWFVEFHRIIASGGFGVVLGNPPYVEYSKVRKVYSVRDLSTLACGNLYAMMIERSYQLLSLGGRFGFIVQAPLVSTQRMAAARSVILDGSGFAVFSTFDDRPSKLFSGMHHCRLAIVLSERSEGPLAWFGTTRYHKWYSDERETLFQRLRYLPVAAANGESLIPKFDQPVEAAIYQRLGSLHHSLGTMMLRSGGQWPIFYKITGVGHWFTFTLSPPRFWRDGQEGKSTRESTVHFSSKLERDTAFCCLYSTLHYWAYQARTNCRDFNPADVQYLPVPESVAKGLPRLEELADEIWARLEATSTHGSGSYEVGGSVRYQKFKPGAAKDLIDQVDRLLAQHYGFTDEELDFIINYDIKYRMGVDDGEQE